MKNWPKNVEAMVSFLNLTFLLYSNGGLTKI
jgi:hypothetical protein